jgi:acetoin utilization protein AcuB
MLVGERMTRNPVTVHPEHSVTDVRELMKREKVTHVPVLDRQQRLVGILTEQDLARVAPSPATTLSIWEINSLLSKLKVEQVMSREVVSVAEDTPIEDAARIMADNDIGCLPVVKAGKLAGIITESDLFKLFVELFGARQKGLRLTLLIPEKRGELAELTSAISRKGGNIIAIGTFLGEDAESSLCTIKVEGIARAELTDLIEPLVLKIIDARET